MRTVILLAAATLLVSSAARAQDHGTVGITMGYPASVGLVWHIGERVAVRPSIAFSHNSAESDDDYPNPVPSGLVFTSITLLPTTRTSVETSGWNVALGADLLLFLARWENVEAYVTPGYSYRRSSTTTTISFEGLNFGGPVTPSFTDSREVTTDGHEIRGAFGIQYTPHRRFGIFGEVGLRYSTTDASGLSRGVLTETRFTGVASAAGVIFYF